MEQSSLSATSRQNADKNLLTILLTGVGGSLAFHIAAIAGVSHLWQPVAAIDEPMEITMVDVDNPVKTPAIPSPTPKITLAPTKAVPIVKVPATVKPKPAPTKAIPIVKVSAAIEPKSAPKIKTPAPTTAVPIVKSAPGSATKSLSSIGKLPLDNVPSKPVSTPKFNKSPNLPPQQVVAPAFPDKLFNPPPAKIQPTPQPKIARSPTFTPDPIPSQKIVDRPPVKSPGLAGNSSGGKLAGRSADNNPIDNANEDFGAVPPSKINAPTGDNIAGASSQNQSGLTGNSSGNKLAGRLGGNNPIDNSGNPDGDGNFGAIAPSKIKAPTGNGLVGAGGNNPGSGNPSPVAKASNGSEVGGDPGGGSNSGTFGLQCINKCEISGLTDLDDKDGGKDKLRIKIAIDSKGFVSSASIAKSSGNPQIDRVVIDGVKQMQFNPPGKTVERVVKANILI